MLVAGPFGESSTTWDLTHQSIKKDPAGSDQQPQILLLPNAHDGTGVAACVLAICPDQATGFEGPSRSCKVPQAPSTKLPETGQADPDSKVWRVTIGDAVQGEHTYLASSSGPVS